MACVHPQYPGDGVRRAHVHLGVVVEPDVLTGRIGGGLTHKGDRLLLQCGVASLRHRVRCDFNIRHVWSNCVFKIKYKKSLSFVSSSERVGSGTAEKPITLYLS